MARAWPDRGAPVHPATGIDRGVRLMHTYVAGWTRAGACLDDGAHRPFLRPLPLPPEDVSNCLALAWRTR